MISSVAALLIARLALGAILAVGILRWAHPAAPDAWARFARRGAAVLFGLSALLGWGQPEAVPWGVLAVAALLVPAGKTMAGLGAAGAALTPLLGGSSHPGFAVASSVSGAFLLGAVAATMLLGHWYLVDASLSIRPLAIGARLVEAGVWARIAAVALALFAADGIAALRISGPADIIYSTTALFFAFRTITGLLAPAVLATLIRRTVRIRSTQSATGLLYVALILTLFGELTAAFLETLTGGRLA